MIKRTSYASWRSVVEATLSEMEELEVLSDDESVNAETAYDERVPPAEYARRVAADREYRAAKLSGDL